MVLGIEGGDIGFDEGGVFDALTKRPIWNTTEEFMDYDKKGNMIYRRTEGWDVSVGEVLAVLATMGIIKIAPLFVDRISGLGKLFDTTIPDLNDLANTGLVPDLVPDDIPSELKTTYARYVLGFGPIMGPILYRWHH